MLTIKRVVNFNVFGTFMEDRVVGYLNSTLIMTIQRRSRRERPIFELGQQSQTISKVA